MELARTGDLDYSVPLGIVQYLKREQEFLPWKAAMGGLKDLDNLLKGSPLYGPFKVRTKMNPYYA